MKNLLMFCLAFVTLGFVACTAEVVNDDAEETVDLDAIRTEIQTLEDAYAKAQMAKDADGVVAYYSDDAVSLPSEEPALVGKTAILAHTKTEMAEDTVGGTVKYTVVDVFASGNLAVEVGKGVTTRPDGSKTTGKYVSVFEKRDGKWVCIRDIYNNDAPGEN